METIRWRDLSQYEQNHFGNGIWPNLKWFNKYLVHYFQFCFKANGRQHDFYYSRGGNLFDKVKADITFYGYMLVDLCDESHCIKNLLKYFAIATTYFMIVSLFWFFNFTWGKYKTKCQILWLEQQLS